MSDESRLPNGWMTLPLAECGKWFGGGTPSKANLSFWTNGCIAWVSPKDMKVFRINDAEDHITDEAVRNSSVSVYPAGTVLMVIRSGILSRTFPVAVATVDATMNQDMKGVKTVDAILPEFLAFQLISNERRILSDCSKHGTTVASIDTQSLQRFEIHIAPLAEQCRIVAKIEELFSDLDAGVAALKRAKANLKRYRAAVLKAAVEGKLTEEWRAEHPDTEPASKLLERILAERRQKWEADQLAKFAAAGKEPPKNWREKYVEPKPPDTTGLPELPEGWCWATVKQVADTCLGKMLDKSKHLSGFKLPYLRNINVRWGSFIVDDLLEMYFKDDELDRFSLHEGDVLVCEGGEPGRAAVWNNQIEGMKFQKALHRVRCFPGFQPWYLVHFLEHMSKSLRLERFFTGTTIKHFTGESFAQLPIPLPPFVEQQQIVDEVAEKLSQIEAAETIIDHGLCRAASLRQSILKQAFEGKLVPQDPIDEPATILLKRILSQREATVADLMGARLRKPKRPQMKPNLERLPLVDVVAKHPKGVSPDDAFREAGYDQENVNDVDGFYAELDRNVKKKTIEVQRPDDATILLMPRAK